MTGRRILDDLAGVIDQYRASVAADLEAIPEEAIWRRPVPGMVSPANLTVHIAGNLRHFIGHSLAGTDYVRDRDREFALTGGLSRQEVLAAWHEGTAEAAAVLRGLDPARLEAPAPVDKYPGSASTHYFVTRLVAHLSYHAGQIRMLRRILVPEPPERPAGTR